MGHAVVVPAAVGVPTWCPALGACQLSTLPSPCGAGLNPVLWLMEQRLIKALPEVTQPVGGERPPELSPCKVLSPPVFWVRPVLLGAGEEDNSPEARRL